MQTVFDPLWRADFEYPQARPTLESDLDTEVVIIGGGLSGISAAYHLSKQGKKVAVLEKERLGCCASGHNTAHVSYAQCGVYDKYIKKFGKLKAMRIHEANVSAVERMQDIISEEGIECGWRRMRERLTAFTKKGVKKLYKEAAAYNELGADYQFSHGAEGKSEWATLTTSGHATFNPLKYLYGLAQAAENNKAKIYEYSKATKIHCDNNGCVVLANGHSVSAEYVIVATNMPNINFPGLYFIKTVSERAYAAAYPQEVDQNIDLMTCCVDDGGYTSRPCEGGVVFSGEDHRAGVNKGKAFRYNNIHKYAQSLGITAQPSHVWSAQDVVTVDNLPYIGHYSKGMPKCLVITGFNKYGLTSSCIAGRLVTDIITGKENPLIDVYSPSRGLGLGGILKVLSDAMVMLYYYVKGLFVFKNPICPHLKCRLSFNPDDNTWDCPCHGSRFHKDGKLISAPAIKDLKE